MSRIKRPFVIICGSKTEWPSHDYILPAVIETLKGLPAEIIRFRNDDTLNKKNVNRIKQEASCLIILPPLGLGLRAIRQLRERHDIQVPCIFFETSHMCMGAIMFLRHRALLRTSDHFVAPSAAACELLRHAFSGHKNIHQIPYPILSREMRPLRKSERIQFRKSLGLGADDPFFIYAGRITRQKNVDAVLKAFSNVIKKYPRAKLFLIGSPQDEYSPQFGHQKGRDVERDLRLLIDNLKLSKNVLWTGRTNRSRLRKFLSSCTAQISLTTFYTEEFGYGIAEGLSCGAATIVSEWGGGRDFAAGGAIGVPVQHTSGIPVPHIAAAGSAFLKIIRERSLWSERAKKFAHSNLSQRAVLKKWQTVIEMTVSQPHTDTLIEWRRTHLRRFFALVANPASISTRIYSPNESYLKLISRVYAGESP